MPIVQNRYYNDPGIAQGVANLASIFAPPDAGETLAYAQANAVRAKEARLADFMARAPEMDAATYDRLGPALDLWTPNQGVGITQRAQDIESADRRYNTDTTARTTLATNAADNQRQITTTMLQPVLPGSTRFVPPTLADMYHVPQQQTGAISVSPGEQTTLPDGRVVAGAAKPLSETEAKAMERQDLRHRGLISDQDLIDTIIGAETPVEAIGPAGRPAFMSPGAAVRTGAQPVPRQPLVNVNNGPAGDGKLREKLDENEGKRWSDLQGAATTASGLQQDLGLLNDLIEQAPQGPLVGRLAEAFPESTTAGAAFQSIVSRAAPGLRVEGSGATSDIEYNGMVRSLPRLRNNPEANRLIIGMMQAKADLNIRRGEIVTAYQNGQLDAAQTRQQLGALNRQSILSPGLRSMIERAGGEAATAGPAASAVEPGTVEDGYRYRGGDPADAANWEPVR